MKVNCKYPEREKEISPCFFYTIYFMLNIHNYCFLQGHKKVGDLWRKSGLEWSDFVSEDKISQFVKDKVC